jgi:hypothetical protein
VARPRTETPLERIVQFVKRWLIILGLTEWDVEVEFVDEDTDSGDVTDFSPDPTKVVLMCTDIARGYKRATISIYPRVLGFSPAKQEQCVVHELVHLVVEPLDDLLLRQIGTGEVFGEWRRLLEGTVDHISNRLMEVCRAYRT